jgi:4-amino-4-deoxy-L-arabinose transferase-like glycosyltransferase
LGISAKFYAVFVWCAFLSGCVYISKDFSKENLSLMFILSAVFFNLNFISTTGFNWVQYDILSCYNYIEYIIENNFMFWRENPLLTRPSYSAYHPILHFFVAGIGLKLAHIISDNIEVANEVVQVVFLYYIFAFYIYANRIIEMFKFNRIVHLIVLVMVCFFPIFNAMAGYFNNDGLLLMLQSASVYYALMYYRDGCKKHLWLMALSVILACLTKLSGVVVLPMIGAIMLVKFWQKCEISYFYELFLVGIVIILGVMIWPMYQYFILGVNFNYVPPQEHLSLIGYSYWERFNPLKAIIYKQMFYNDNVVNLWETLTKTAIYGQWNFEAKAKDIFVLVQIIDVCYKMILCVIFGGFAWLICKKQNINFYFICVLIFGVLSAHVIFGIMHPYMCNMDFRYVAILILPMAIVLGMMVEKFNRLWKLIIASIIGVFVVSSVIIWWWIVL